MSKKRAQEVIVSLTAIPSRFHKLHLVIETILSQTVKPDRVVLWLSHVDRHGNRIIDDVNQLPDILQRQIKRGLEIRFCEDLRSYRKLIPALQAFTNEVLVTADDDTLYPKFWLEKLYYAHLVNPQDVICYRGSRISFDSNGHLLPYLQWPEFIERDTPSFALFPTGGEGALYPQGVFNETVMDKDVFMDICLTADDVWFKAMSLYNGIKSRKITEKHQDFARIDGTQAKDDTLHFINNVMGQNDVQIKAVFERYNLVSKLKFLEGFYNERK
ncbi:hypothetical protein OR1_02866 [Geobacter sp. OR-1]|nr:hypothetical protein OR1_02866 [Geobacter sp. OR-1]